MARQAVSPNPGYCPAEVAAKRVRVKLRNGTLHGHVPVNNDSKLGWAAETTDWQLTGSAFDVMEWAPA